MLDGGTKFKGGPASFTQCSVFLFRSPGSPCTEVSVSLAAKVGAAPALPAGSQGALQWSGTIQAGPNGTGQEKGAEL